MGEDVGTWLSYSSSSSTWFASFWSLVVSDGFVKLIK